MLADYSNTIRTARLIGASAASALVITAAGIAHAAPDFESNLTKPHHVQENIDLTALRYPNFVKSLDEVSDVSGGAFARKNISDDSLAPQNIAEFSDVTTPNIPVSQHAMRSSLDSVTRQTADLSSPEATIDAAPVATHNTSTFSPVWLIKTEAYFKPVVKAMRAGSCAVLERKLDHKHVSAMSERRELLKVGCKTEVSKV